MAKGKKKVLVIGKLRIRLPDRVAQMIMGAGTGLKDRASPLVRRKVQLGRFNVPIVFFLVAILAILPIGMAFGTGESTPTFSLNHNLTDSIQISNIHIYEGSPSDYFPIELKYEDGTPIDDGDYWLSFDWEMKDPTAKIEPNDYFDIELDLGLSELPAIIAQQKGTWSPTIYAKNPLNPEGPPIAVGSIIWTNYDTYENDTRITIRFIFNELDPNGLPGGETEQFHGTGMWAFEYKCTGHYDTEKIIVWRFIGHDEWPGIKVKPKPPKEKPPGSGEYYLPYAKYEKGYKKYGKRLTPDSTAPGDSIYYWNIMVNGHKHKSLEEWDACEHNTASFPNHSDPAPEVSDDGAILITDKWTNMTSTYLREVTKVNGKAVVNTSRPWEVDHSRGLYGNTKAATNMAYIKLYYVDTANIWNKRINYVGSPYETPIVDPNPNHKPSEGNPVGKYDPMYTTWLLEEGEADAVLYAPNYMQSGGEYAGYLSVVPEADIKSISVDANGLQVEIYASGLFGTGSSGKTLAIAYMTKPKPNQHGYYSSRVGNVVEIGYIKKTWVASCDGEVLMGGTVDGRPPTPEDKGKFILKKFNSDNSMAPMANVPFTIKAIPQSENDELAGKINAVIEGMRIPPPGSEQDNPYELRTGEDGKIVINLLDADIQLDAWQTDLVLEITEHVQGSFVGPAKFTVTIKKSTGEVDPDNIVFERPLDDTDNVIPETYGVIVLNENVPPPDVYDVALRKWIKKVERTVLGVAKETYYRENPHTGVPFVRDGDKVLYRIDVYNQGAKTVTLHAGDVSDWLPPGLIFDPAATVAHHDDGGTPYDNSLWKVDEDWVATDKYPVKLIYDGPDFEIQGWGGERTADGQNDYHDKRLALILTVDVPNSNNLSQTIELKNIARVGHLDVDDVDSCIYDDPELHKGAEIDNEIEDKHKDENGECNDLLDEDTHDYAKVKVKKAISCEVDKDTIKRTSAAFNGAPMDVTIDGTVVNNVGIEKYRYDVNFRSTANWDADEFVVTDPLENVKEGLVRLTGLWTPAVWGDLDGRMNVWYKTKNGGGASAALPTSPVTPKENPLYPTLASDGWKLWTTIDQSAPGSSYSTTGVIGRVKLNIYDSANNGLNLPANDYVTALRFEYGPVAVGFTSKNYSSKSQNGEHRNTSGTIVMDPDDLNRLDIPRVSAIAPAAQTGEPLYGVGGAYEPEEVAEGNFFTRLIAFFTGKDTESNSANNGVTDGTAGANEEIPVTQDYSPIAAFGIGGPSDAFDDQADVTPEVFIDWTPNEDRDDYSAEAKAATGLLPATYMVECLQAMEDVNIVSSATAQIAQLTRFDEDVDAVLTKEIVPFTLEEGEDNEYTLNSTFEDDIPKLTPNSEEGTGGRSSRTFDDMNPLFWIGMAATALAAAMLVFLMWCRYRRRVLAAARAGRRRSR